MQSHLITDITNFGIWEDDFATFFKERAKVVSKRLSNKIMPQKSQEKMEEYEEFFEEEVGE